MKLLKTQKERSYFQLLVALGAIMLIQPFVEAKTTTLENYIISLFFLVFLLTSLKAFTTRGIKPKSRIARSGIKILAAVAFLTDLAEALLWGKFDAAAALGALSTACYACLIFSLCIIIIKDLFSGRKVTADKIYGAIAVYLLLGLLWTSFYGLLIFFNPQAIIAADGELINTFSEVLYFSYTTLCTLGYGDIIANNKVARTLTNLEAITGQLYLAILVGRLVGLYIAQAKNRV